MLGDYLIQLACENFETANADHVLKAVNDKEIAILIHGGNIAGVHISITDGVCSFLGFVMVTPHNLRATRAKLTRLARLGQLAGRWVNQLDLRVRYW